MNMLIIAPDFYPTVGGYAHAISNLVRACLDDARPIHVHVLTTVPVGGQGEWQAPGLTVQRLPQKWRGYRYAALLNQTSWIAPIVAAVKSRAWDLILVETFEHPITLAGVLTLIPGTILQRVAARIHGVHAMEGFSGSTRLIDRLYWRLVKYNLRRLPNVLSTNTHYFSFLAGHGLDLAAMGKRTGVVSNIVFAAQAQPADVDNGALELLCLGRMNARGYEQKNFPLVAHAVARLKTAAPEIYSRLCVRVVGEGEMLEPFRDLLQSLGVQAAFLLEGRLEHQRVITLQRRVAGVILVSKYEGQSMFALESLAAGAPLILSRNTGMSDLVVDADAQGHGANGFLVDADSPQALCAALVKLAGADRGVLRQRSRQHYMASFQPHQVVGNLVDFAGQLRGS